MGYLTGASGCYDYNKHVNISLALLDGIGKYTHRPRMKEEEFAQGNLQINFLLKLACKIMEPTTTTCNHWCKRRSKEELQEIESITCGDFPPTLE